MTRPWLRVGAIVLLLGVLAWWLDDFIRDAIVIPLLYSLWRLSVLLRSFGQFIPWAVFLVVALVVALKSLLRDGSPSETRPARERIPQGRVQGWARAVFLAAGGSYLEWRLARRLAQIALQVLAQRERLTAEQIKRRLDAGTLDLPPDVLAYLRLGLSPSYLEPFFRRRRRFFARRRSAQRDRDLEQVVSLLENQQEVNDDRRAR